MQFSEKYTPAAENEKDKRVISNDAFAVGEIIQELCDKIERLRLSL